jgi:hypothetical protein
VRGYRESRRLRFASASSKTGEQGGGDALLVGAD